MTNAVYKGVIAFMMDAKPTLTMVCPEFRRLYGNTLSRTPMTRKGIHADAPRAPNGREPYWHEEKHCGDADTGQNNRQWRKFDQRNTNAEESADPQD